MRKNLAKIHELARQKLLDSSDHQKRQYDIRSNTKSYRQGDKVFVFDPSKRKGICLKLQCRWSGPFEVVEKLSDLLYRVKFSQIKFRSYIITDLNLVMEMHKCKIRTVRPKILCQGK